MSTNQHNLENLRGKAIEGLREGKNYFQGQYDFPQPEITISFETKTYQGLAPFEVLPDDHLEKLELYYHELSKLEEAWNGFVNGEPRGPGMGPTEVPPFFTPFLFKSK